MILFLKAKIFVEQWSTSAKEIVERLKTSHVASHSVRRLFSSSFFRTKFFF